jgi:hypothetical protein
MIGLNKQATVYLANETDGAFDVAVGMLMPCRLAVIQRGPGETTDERERVSEKRLLLYAPWYELPEPAQLLVDGQRWQVVEGVHTAVTGPQDQVVYQRREVLRVV